MQITVKDDSYKPPPMGTDDTLSYFLTNLKGKNVKNIQLIDKLLTKI